MKPSNRVFHDADEHGLRLILLQAGYTAEHEMGIGHLQKDLGCPRSTALGLEARTIALQPDAHRKIATLVEDCADEEFYVEVPVKNTTRTRVKKTQQRSHRVTILVGRDIDHDDLDRLTQTAKQHAKRYRTEDIFAAAWDNHGFSITGYDKGIGHVREIYAALIRNDLALWTAAPSTNPFERAGLVIALPSRTLQSESDALRSADERTIRLDKAAAATGIQQRLDAANGASAHAVFHTPYAYWSLSPSELDPSKNSAYPVQFWLNPIDTDKNQSGFYTVEELDQWISGEGPVYRKKRQKRM